MPNKKRIKFEIATPERVLMKEIVHEIIVPTEEGELGILPKHSPLVASLKPGVLEIKKADGSREVVFVDGGFLEVLRNKVVILADAAERAEEIDLQKVEEARARAEKAMSEIRQVDAEKFAGLSAQLERELARTKAVKRWKKIKI